MRCTSLVTRTFYWAVAIIAAFRGRNKIKSWSNSGSRSLLAEGIARGLTELYVTHGTPCLLEITSGNSNCCRLYFYLAFIRWDLHRARFPYATLPSACGERGIDPSFSGFRAYAFILPCNFSNIYPILDHTRGPPGSSAYAPSNSMQVWFGRQMQNNNKTLVRTSQTNILIIMWFSATSTTE